GRGEHVGTTHYWTWQISDGANGTGQPVSYRGLIYPDGHMSFKTTGPAKGTLAGVQTDIGKDPASNAMTRDWEEYQPSDLGGGYLIAVPANPLVIDYTLAVDDAHRVGQDQPGGATGTVTCHWSIPR